MLIRLFIQKDALGSSGMENRGSKASKKPWQRLKERLDQHRSRGDGSDVEEMEWADFVDQSGNRSCNLLRIIR